MIVTFHDALERGHRIQPDRLAEACRLGFHALQDREVRFQHPQFPGATGGAGAGDRQAEFLFGDRHLEQLLFVHLQRAIATTQGRGPHPITDYLDLLVSRGLDIELDQDVLVVTDAGGFYFRQDLARPFRCPRSRPRDALLERLVLEGLQRAENALTLAATAADRLQPNPVVRILAVHLRDTGLQLGAHLLDTEQVDALAITGIEHRISLHLESDVIAENRVVHRKLLGAHQCAQRGSVRILGKQGENGQVVDTRRDTDANCQRSALGLVLETGAADGTAAGSDEAQPRLLDRLDQFLVLGHETVSGKNGIVAIVVGDGDDLADALRALLPARTGVIGNAVHAPRIGQGTQLGRQCVGIDDRILFREQDTEAGDAHLLEHIHRLATDRAATDDQRTHVLAAEAAYPGAPLRTEAAVAVNQGIVEIVIVAASHGI